MKCVLTPNLEPPFNLRQIYPNPDLFDQLKVREDGLLRLPSEAEVLAYVIKRNKEVGVIPCESEAERDMCLAHYQTKHPRLPLIVLPPVGPHYVVDETDLPDDYFLDCWEWDNGCQVNMPRARILHMGKIRMARAPVLLEADQDVEKAIDRGDSTAERTARLKRQVLRDIPQTFDLTVYPTPETLKSAWPPELPARE